MKFEDAVKALKATKCPQQVTTPSTVESVRVMISIRIDAEVLRAIKDKAGKLAIPYQTLINSWLTQLSREA